MQERRRRTRWLIALCLLGAVVALLLWWRGQSPGPPAPAPSPAVDRTYAYAGFPVALSADSGFKLLRNAGFVVGYSETRRNPLWVCYRLFNVTDPHSQKRPSHFRTDRRTSARVADDDFTHTGYDRGHLAPNWGISTRYGRQAQLQTFLLTNVCPQRPNLNRGPWRVLEERLADDHAERCAELWITTGPVFDADHTFLPSRLELPDAFYKLVVDENNGRPRAMAYLLPQDIALKEDPDRFLTTIDAVEQQTGLDFLRDLPDPVETTLEATVGRW